MPLKGPATSSGLEHPKPQPTPSWTQAPKTPCPQHILHALYTVMPLKTPHVHQLSTLSLKPPPKYIYPGTPSPPLLPSYFFLPSSSASVGTGFSLTVFIATTGQKKRYPSFSGSCPARLSHSSLQRSLRGSSGFFLHLLHDLIACSHSVPTSQLPATGEICSL